MSTLEAIEAQIRQLPPRDFACLRDWFHNFEEECWDKQIAQDFQAGKLNRLIAKARREFSEGEVKEL